MSIIQVVIKPSFGGFEMTDTFKAYVQACGHKSPFSIEARIDSRIHDFINNASNKTSVHSYNRIVVVDVDSSKPWTIADYDGSEGIAYPEYKQVRPDINYVEVAR